jgi:glycosyltransferase involved in cell wall biosynthesis
MQIGIDISPLKTGNFLQHRVRGTGFYLENLKKALLQYFPSNQYTFFTRTENLPNNLDLIHIPYFEPFFLTLPKENRIKKIVTVHDLTPLVFPSEFPSGIKGKIKWQIQKSRLRKISYIITDSESSKKDIVKFTGISSSKISVVYLAAGEHFKVIKSGDQRLKNVKDKYNLPDKFGLYVGDTTWNKNLPRIIQSFIKTCVPLYIIGKAVAEENFDKTNPWNKDLTKVQELIKTSNLINTLGFIPDEDLVCIYNLATFFAMPSLYEGFGLPILEAMVCGCPVITSKSGSIEEIAGSAAFFVDPYKESEIANGIKEVFENEKLRKELSEKGLAQTKKFSWKETAENTVKVYEKIAAAN